MNLPTYTLEELIQKLKKIKNLGYIVTTHPHQGGVGSTLETQLGIKENNLRVPDLGEIELKAKRVNSDSMLTLASKSPLPRGVNRKLFESMKTEGEDGIQRLYTTVYGTINNRELRVYLDKEKLMLDNPLKIEAYWILEKLDDVLKEGTKHILLVFAETKGEFASKSESFNYTEAYLLSGLSLERLKKAIENNKLKVDIRIGADKTGKAAGRYHDHGTGFRLHKRDFLDLFETQRRIM